MRFLIVFLLLTISYSPACCCSSQQDTYTFARNALPKSSTENEIREFETFVEGVVHPAYYSEIANILNMLPNLKETMPRYHVAAYLGCCNPLFRILPQIKAAKKEEKEKITDLADFINMLTSLNIMDKKEAHGNYITKY